MKRKDSYSPSEASFDTLMADAANRVDLRVESVQADQANVEVTKECSTLSRLEVDRDSDYEGSVFENKGDVTTLRMLFDKCHSSDADFYESCLDVGLLCVSNGRCLECDAETPLVETPSNVDNLLRRCSRCDVEWSVRRDSWCEGIEASLKDLIITVYCWCRNYPQSLAAHETDVDPAVVSSVYTKCAAVPQVYFQNPVSNLGGDNRRVLIDLFTYNDRTLIAMSDTLTNDVFYQILNPDYDESQIVTIIIDNLRTNSDLIADEKSQLTHLLDPECQSYLKESWDIDFHVENISTNHLILKWSEFETLLPPENNLDPTFKHLNPKAILQQALFRKRMESSKDCFLYFLNIVSELFNNSYH